MALWQFGVVTRLVLNLTQVGHFTLLFLRAFYRNDCVALFANALEQALRPNGNSGPGPVGYSFSGWQQLPLGEHNPFSKKPYLGVIGKCVRNMRRNCAGLQSQRKPNRR